MNNRRFFTFQLVTKSVVGSYWHCSLFSEYNTYNCIAWTIFEVIKDISTFFSCCSNFCFKNVIKFVADMHIYLCLIYAFWILMVQVWNGHIAITLYFDSPLSLEQTFNYFYIRYTSSDQLFYSKQNHSTIISSISS